MKLFLKNHTYKYAVEQILLMMFPEERPEYPEGKPDGDFCVSAIHEGEVFTTAACTIILRGMRFYAASREKTLNGGDLERDRQRQKLIKLSFYHAALKTGMEKPVWGALTGIRPGKILSNYLLSGMGEAAAVSRFRREYDVSPERARLSLFTAKAGLAEKSLLKERDICLYIGIPFCPTRCTYCSFVSQSVEKSMKLIPPFLEALYAELDETARIVEKLGLRPVSVYFGGGTPTTLTARQSDELCTRLSRRFDLTGVREFTVEAGRPDTITAEKLDVLRSHGVTRVSVNPQSMRDDVLAAIGRRHTAADIVDALGLVRVAGGMSVNMDLIAGLPADTPQGFSETLDEVLKLSPENITVHTLSLKKGTKITLGESAAPLPTGREVGLMLDEAGKRLGGEYIPYYLYRQKFMSGGFENVGWCKPGFESEYNIAIMEELCSIISMGGGGSTKLVSPGGRIERIFAPKFPKEFIEGIEKTMMAKSKIEVFYNAIPTDIN